MKRMGKYSLIMTTTILCFCISASPVSADTKLQDDIDVRFLQDASASNSWMMTLGDLALRQAASGDVREFSRRMIEDQEGIRLNLKRLSDRKGVKLEADRDKIRLNTTAYLSKEYGAAFDRLYMSLLMDEHQRNVVLYKEEIEKGRDGDIKAFAGGVLKKLEAYTEMAKKILAGIPKPFLK